MRAGPNRKTRELIPPDLRSAHGCVFLPDEPWQSPLYGWRAWFRSGFVGLSTALGALAEVHLGKLFYRKGLCWLLRADSPECQGFPTGRA